jgi:hypothetical protein
MYILYIYYTQFSDTPIYLDVPNAIVFFLIGYSVRKWESTANHILLVAPWIPKYSLYIFPNSVGYANHIKSKHGRVHIYIYMHVYVYIYMYMYTYIYI